MRNRYAELFRLPADQLDSLPDRFELPVGISPGYKNAPSVRIDFHHRQSAHCESGVTANLLSHHGQTLSEAMVFGIGGGLLFGYFPFVRVNHLPLTTFRTFPGAIFKKCAKRLGFRFNSRTYRHPAPAMRALDEVLAKGTPAGLQTGVYWLPYFPPALRFHFNAHNLVVCGRQGDQYLVSDPLFDTFMNCSGKDLEKARFAKGALAPRGRMYWITEFPEEVDLRSAAVAGIREVARNMVSVPVPLLGVRGMKLLAGRMKTWPEKLGRKRAVQYLGHLIRMQEEIGTGGGGFRFIYAAFLQEVADLMSNRRVAELAGEMTDIGDLWRQFALLSARNCKGREGANSSFPALAGLLSGCADREEALFRELLMLVR
ncbi:MAG: BtrH N-terminal domain-containing protein [Deltaproteobacteria bacterium]|nr:BtrH N-terminal domain-containing protein [Deltaproteobacteria bacterium]